MTRARFRRRSVVVSVEHASARVPRELGDLGLDPRWLRGHHAWDPGAATAGRLLAWAFDAPLHLGHVSRLVVDLNRSANHPRVVPRTLRPEDVAIPANAGLDRAGRRARLERYWRPWREAVEADMDAAVTRCGVVLHVSVHSFTPQIAPDVPPRDNDFALMYWPSLPHERALADRLAARLEAAGYRVRRNWPYAGHDDGFCMRMRHERDPEHYVGMEFEMNQRTCATPAGARRLALALRAALEPEIAPGRRSGARRDRVARRQPR